jgi:hypothetical protein
MSRLPLVLLVLLVPLFGAAQTTLQFHPPLAIAGDPVDIRVAGACSAAFTFGGAPARVLSCRGDVALVTVPEHAPGEVEVRAATSSGVATGTFRVTAPEEWERVLLPLSIWEPVGVEGAFGSRWIAATYAASIGGNPLYLRRMEWCVPIRTSLCPRTPPYMRVQDVSFVPFQDWNRNPAAGAFLFYPRETKHDIALQSRFMNFASSTAVPTEQPLVPVSRFRTQLSLLNVALGAQVRAHIRIYAPNARGARARLRIRSAQDPAAAVERFVDLHEIADEAALSEEFHFTPASAIVSIDDVQLPPPARIDVLSLDGTPLWAMASVTHNTTQFVTLVTPQP